MNRLDYKLIFKIYICFIAYYFISVFVIERFIYGSPAKSKFGMQK